jgi:hypothetical protein
MVLLEKIPKADMEEIREAGRRAGDCSGTLYPPSC